jgi:predicted transcriptional regulator
MVKKAALSIRIPESVKKAIDRAAVKDRRSTSSLVEIILADWLEAHAPRKPEQTER